MPEPDFAPSLLITAKHFNDEVVIPLTEEQLVIGKQVTKTGAVRLHKHTEERTETVEASLTDVRWHVEHIPVNEVVAERPEIRQEGDTTIYPVVEERITVRRELVLLEELRVTRNAVTRIETSDHILRREHISEERVSAGSERP